jgi:hypothetical protein
MVKLAKKHKNILTNEQKDGRISQFIIRKENPHDEKIFFDYFGVAYGT